MVREHAAAVLAGLLKGGDEDLARDFRDRAYMEAKNIQRKRKQRNLNPGQSIASIHGAVLALAASVLSVPYDMPRRKLLLLIMTITVSETMLCKGSDISSDKNSWLPEHVTLLAHFVREPSPVKSTVTKAVAEFRRTHADTWNVQKDSFSEEQLEVLADTSSSSSYFA
ncbi:Proteasome activator subunit 4 [Vitis vinifera]|uniref:Proteasome activator subunit 4 n=1 Tax=Vitis vinifera TaxID=29760 RepID=A0A438EQW1_VITVI|nr:Proteasome activator subunit 4 [Vitis vinifera]RVX14575.1 Proteasome activator subunit 4 [Vitis vinifera]